MAQPKSVWGIDVGKRALKALKLRIVEGNLQVEAFDIIDHPKVLTPSDTDSQEIIRSALLQFVARNDLSRSSIALAVPGQSSFTRFVPLPPVEKKKIPDIVRFEAEQQIPFAIDDVVWRWQTFQDPDSPDVEVGIFAMKRTDINEAISHFSEIGVKIDLVQMAPLGLYNFMRFDKQLAPDGATLLADVGTDKTDIVISDGARIWTRTIQIGGNNFTDALVRAFKLSFSKAEKLKRTAATSKYARQIFQAMRPVFAELVQEIQRSVGYYSSLHRETRFKKLVGLGNGFRLPGLQKFLEQNLNMPVVRIDTYNRLEASPTVNAPAFTENVLSFPVAYGLALQGLGLAEVNTNLLPGEIAQQRLWVRKIPWFAAAAAAMLVSIGLHLYRAYTDRDILADGSGTQRARQIVDAQNALAAKLRELEGQDQAGIREIQRKLGVFKYRTYWPAAENLLYNSLNQAFSDQWLLRKYGRYLAIDKTVREAMVQKDAPDVQSVLTTRQLAELMSLMEARSAQELTAVVRQLHEFEVKNRGTRRIAVIERTEVEYHADARQATAFLEAMQRRESGRMEGALPPKPPVATEQPKRAFSVIMTVRTPLSTNAANDVFTEVKKLSEEGARKLKILAVKWFPPASLGPIGGTPGGGGSAAPAGAMPAGAIPPDMVEPGFGVSWPPDTGMPIPTSPPPSAATGPKMPDPLFPHEDMSSDMRFKIGWVLTIEDSEPTNPGK